MEDKKEVKEKETKRKGLPSFDELRKVDVTKYVKKRDNADYLNWATVKQLLHDNGAETVYFLPITNKDGSSLFMSEQVFESDTKKNRCYETRIEIHIDDKTYIMQSPVMNGANPVQDNSMTQQRVWNSMCRSFVKGVAMYTGLGFELWCKQETEEFDNDDSSFKHDILRVLERVQETVTTKMKLGLSLGDIASQLKISEDEFKAYLAYYKTLARFEKAIEKVDIKQE